MCLQGFKTCSISMLLVTTHFRLWIRPLIWYKVAPLFPSHELKIFINFQTIKVFTSSSIQRSITAAAQNWTKISTPSISSSQRTQDSPQPFKKVQKSSSKIQEPNKTISKSYKTFQVQIKASSWRFPRFSNPPSSRRRSTSQRASSSWCRRRWTYYSAQWWKTWWKRRTYRNQSEIPIATSFTVRTFK